MWKKLGVTLIALLSTFSVVYAMNREMNAAGTIYNAGGNVTGRVAKAPSNLSLASGATNIGMQKGDKVLSGVESPFEIGFQLIYDDGATYGWYTMSTKSLGKMPPFASIPNGAEWANSAKYTALGWESIGPVGIYRSNTQAKTNFNAVLDSFNKNLRSTSIYNIVGKRNTDFLTDISTKTMVVGTNVDSYQITQKDALNNLKYSGKIAFLPDYQTMKNSTGSGSVIVTSKGYGILNKDLTFYDKYALNSFRYQYIGGKVTSLIPAILSDGSLANGQSGVVDLEVRAALMLNTSDVVFAVSQGTSNNLASVVEPKLSTSYTSIYDATIKDKDMKVRIYDSLLTATLNDLVNNDDEKPLIVKNGSSELAKDETLKFDVTSASGDVVSAIIFNKNGAFVGYKPLEASKGAGKYEFDTTGLAIGEYQVGIVSETYDESSTQPTKSSLISDVLPLRIVEPHTITYTAAPQSQLTYEYDKNVDAGQKVGTISRTDGVVPIHYEVVADGSDTTFQNFEISGLDVNGDSSATSLDVKVKSSGAPNLVSSTNSLKAGTYKFCIESKDANGDPVTQTVGKSKVCTSLIVGKTTPTIAFVDTSKKDMAIGDSTYVGDITYTNMDTVPSSKISYALTNGISGNILSVNADASDPKKYNAAVLASYTGSSLPTTFDVNVTIAETENYKSATTTTKKQIYVYKDISALNWVPNKSGSFSTADVASGSTIGKLLASDGVEDFTYELAKPGDTGYIAADAVDNSSFSVVNGTGLKKGISADIQVSSTLTEKTYKVQFKVTDSKGKIAYKSVEVKVTAQAQNPVVFKSAQGGTPISSYTMKVNETSRSLYAEGGSTGGSAGVGIEYYLADASDQPSGLTGVASDYAGIATIGGLITPKKAGTIKVYAKSPGNTAFGDELSSLMELIIEPAVQSVQFTNPVTSKVEVGKTIQETATGTVTLTNTPGEGGITYSSSDTSIATVDATGKVTGIAKGSVTITATLNDANADGKADDPNYERKTTTKTVNIYTGMSIKWTPATTNLKAVTSLSGAVAGVIDASNNSGPVEFKISGNTGGKNVDAKYFQLGPNNTSCDLKLVGSVSAADVLAHGNKFLIQVDVKDGNGTQTIDIEVTIDNADNDVYFKDNGVKVTKITKQFGEGNDTFNFSVNTSNGGNVTYSIVTTQPLDVVTTTGTGVAKIVKVGTTKAQAVVGAGGGFSAKTVSVDVEITPGIQEVSFNDTTTTNQAFVAGSQFSELATLSETSAKTTSSRAIAYTSKDTAICTVDQAGTVTMVAKGKCVIEIENTHSNWTTTKKTKDINLYDGMGVTFNQPTIPQAGTTDANANSIIGNLSISGGQGTKTSSVSTSGDPKNKDAKYFDVIGTNIVLKQKVDAADLAGKYDAVKGVYVLHVQFKTVDMPLGTTVTTDAIVEFKGAKLDVEFNTGSNTKISEVYGKDRVFLASLKNNLGGGTPKYQLKVDAAMPSDVLKSVAPDGTITIENANDRVANANPVMIEAIIPPNNGYEGKTIEVEVEITQAPQPGFGFTNSTIKMSTESTMTPTIKNKLSKGIVSISSSNASIVKVNGTSIESNTKEGTVTITVIDPGDRNYKSATNTATVEVSSAPAYGFIIEVPTATYGDTGIQATIKLDELATEHPGEVGTQTWVSSDTSIADVDASGNITIYRAGTVDITCTQTSTGGVPTVRSTATLVIDPKPITITIGDAKKYVGEVMPNFSATVPLTDLVGADTIGQPTISCLDGQTNVTKDTGKGTYPITGSYATGAYPDYDITVTAGTLTVNQDSSLASWYHLEGVTSGLTLDPAIWYSEDVKVVLDSAIEDTRTYDEISLDQTLWDKVGIIVTNEDENSEDVYFRIDPLGSVHAGAISTSQATTIKIDKTQPVVKSITGTQTNKGAISTLINNLTFGAFFKPGTKVSILSEDILPTPTSKVSGLQDVSYEVYEIDRATGIISTTPIDLDTKTPDATGNVEVTLSDTGLYRVCAIAKDNAGNISAESCSDLNVKKVDIDIDNDNELEFQDPEKDGCPDINIPLQDAQGDIYKINVDRDGDGIPDLNIDSDGDGLAEINVDTDNDGRPDINLVILTTWTPTFCVTGQKDNEGKPIEYCTMKGIKPVVNVDTGNDGQPDVDIDTNGDMKPDYNITKDGKTPIINIGPVHPWDPKTDYDSEGFAYDSIKKDQVTPQINIDTDGDGRPDVNLDPTNSGEPTLNIDVDGDGIPDVDIDSDGDGIADINIDEDGNGTADKNIVKITEWLPDHDSDSIKDFPYDTMNTLKLKDTIIDEDSGIQIQKPGGSFLPNHAIKVENIKDTIGSDDKDKMDALLKEGLEIKDIFDVKLTDGTSDIQPDGSIKVRIPLRNDLKDATSVKVILEQLDGTYKEVEATIKDGFIEYETDFLGKVGIVADKVVEEPLPEPEPDPELKPDIPMPDLKPSGSGGSTPDTSVKGNYTQGVGGAGTGDTTVLFPYGISISVALGILLFIGRRYMRKNHHEV